MSAIRAFMTLLFTVGVFSPSVLAQPIQIEVGQEVAVLVRTDALVLPIEPEDLLEQLSLNNVALLARLRNPVAARTLISPPYRFTREQRDRFEPSDPARKIERYVVLRYANDLAAIVAELALKLDVDVEYAVRSTEASFSATPNDDLFNYLPPGTKFIERQWAAKPPALNLEAAWDTQTGHAYIGVLDNGFMPSHPDLQENFRPHLSSVFLASTGNPTIPLDERQPGNLANAGHGVHVAGIIGATTKLTEPNGQPFDNIGVAGTCWRCSLLIGRIGFNGQINDFDMADGINAMIKRGAQVINLSLGYTTGTVDCGASPSHHICLALSNAVQRDVVVVAAAGNQGFVPDRLQFPASDSRTISVGGTQVDGQLWNQTVSLGTPPDSPARLGASELRSNYATNLTLVAPARDIVSTFYANMDYRPQIRCGSATSFSSNEIDGLFANGISASQNPGRLYGICTGTSMAAPFVSGIAGMVRSVNPLLSVAQVRSALTNHAVRPSNGLAHQWGAGVPNAALSVQSVLSTNSRLTPLFALYSPDHDNIVLTTVPQMAVAAALPAWPLPPNAYKSYAWLGNSFRSYLNFPGLYPATFPPRAGQDLERPRANQDLHHPEGLRGTVA